MKPFIKMLIVGAQLGVLGMMGAASLLAADDPVKEAQKRIEESNAKIEEINKRLEEFKRELEEQKKKLEEGKRQTEATKPGEAPKAPDGTTLGFWTPPPKREAPAYTLQSDLESPWGRSGYIIVKDLNANANANAFNDALDGGGANIFTPKQAMYRAEMHSARKIQQHVKQKDAEAKQILNGTPPVPVAK